MWYPNVSELLSNKIISGVANRDMFAMSGYGPSVSEQEMGKELRQIPSFDVLAQTNPQLFGEIVRIFHENYINGETETAATGRLRAIFLPYIRSLMPIAGDFELLSLAKLSADEYAALELDDPKLCFQYASGTTGANFNNLFPKELNDREAALYVEVMKSADAVAHTTPTEAQLRPYQVAVYQKLLAQFPKANVDVLFKRNLTAADYLTYCNNSIAMMDAIAALGVPGGPMMLRNIYRGLHAQ